jgi:hypothetical protein
LKLLLLGWHLLGDDESCLIFNALVENTSVQELSNINPCRFGFPTYTRIWSILKCNEQLNRVALLLAPPPPPPPPWQQQQQEDMMLKVSHKAITKFATVGFNNAGASAIFTLFQANHYCCKCASNPQLLLLSLLLLLSFLLRFTAAGPTMETSVLVILQRARMHGCCDGNK